MLEVSGVSHLMNNPNIMAKVVVLGAGIFDHTAISYLSKYLKKDREVIMVLPNINFQWVASNI